MTLKQRFWEKVDKGDEDECWAWQASIDNDGYGQFYHDGQMTTAHRVAYMLEKSDPGDKYILHNCHNPPCVNPNHLYAGSQAQNVQDSVELGTHFVPEPRKGKQNDHSKLNESQVREILKMGSEGVSYTKIADEYPVTPSAIGLIVRGDRWSHVDIRSDGEHRLDAAEPEDVPDEAEREDGEAVFEGEEDG